MKASLAAASLLALTLASPCMAIQEVAPPMTVTRIDGRPVDPLAAFAEAGPRSMIVDAVLVTMLNIHSVAAPPPPQQYDKPYPNVGVVYDLPWDGSAWGLTELPARKGGRCVVHLAQFGSAFQEEAGIELLEPVGLPRLIRHEMGHCWGLVHDRDGQADAWFEISDAARKQIAALTHRQWLEITGQDAAPVPVRGSAPPKAWRNITPHSTRSFSGDGY
jgi:hypothetical protein